MRIPHRDDPRDPWPDDEVPKLYRPSPAEPAWPDVDLPDDIFEDQPTLLGPNGQPLPPHDPMPFGFQPTARTEQETP